MSRAPLSRRTGRLTFLPFNVSARNVIYNPPNLLLKRGKNKKNKQASAMSTAALVKELWRRAWNTIICSFISRVYRITGHFTWLTRRQNFNFRRPGRRMPAQGSSGRTAMSAHCERGRWRSSDADLSKRRTQVNAERARAELKNKIKRLTFVLPMLMIGREESAHEEI